MKVAHRGDAQGRRRRWPAPTTRSCAPSAARQAKAIDDLERATDWIVAVYATDPGAVAAGAVYYLKLAGLTSAAG